MLSALQKVIRDVRRIRLRRGVRQDAVAHRLGLCVGFYCDVERGRRPLSQRVAHELEDILGVKPGRFTRGVDFPKRGRRRVPPLTREALLEIGKAISEAVRSSVVEDQPRHRFPRQHHGVENMLWPIALHLGQEAQREVEQLERLREGDETFWRQLNSLEFDSWNERRALVRFGLLGAQFASVSPRRLNCTLPIVSGRTGGDAHRRPCPALVLRYHDMSVAILIQQTIRTEVTHRRPDFILIAAAGSHRTTVLLEIGADCWHADPERERARTKEIGLPVLRARPDHVARPGFATAVLDWVRLRLSSP